MANDGIAARRRGWMALAERRRAEAVAARSPEAARLLGAEAEIAARLARASVEVVDPGGPLPFAPARPPLVDDRRWWSVPTADGARPLRVRLRRVRRAPVLERLDPALRAAAEAYAALVEAVAGAPASPVYEGAATGGGRVSDGGAVARCRLAERLRRAEAAIGDDPVLTPRRGSAQLDRGQRTLGTRALVDAVVLRGSSIEGVLAAHGWSRWQRHRRLARAALEEALRRLARAL